MEKEIRGVKGILNKPELILVLLIISLIASFIEFSYGSAYIGMVFLGICLILLLGISDRRSRGEARPRSILLLFTGVVLITGDLLYNFFSQSRIQTFDTMILLLGASLILWNLNNRRLSELGIFSTHMSLFFLIFFSLLYVIPSKLDIGIPFYYGHYLVALPVCALLKVFGLDLAVPEMNIIVVRGVELTRLKMDLACFGWYSMILIVSTLLAYSITIEHYRRGKLLKIILVLVGASYLANFLRVSILVVLAYYYGVKTMMVFHSHLGWVLFAVILIPLMYILMNGGSETEGNEKEGEKIK
ncbi:MAG TPA: archaeosortase C [Candidatus Syntrophoarchaeum butanivorans]|uniref:Archaeosortase C n=1 Tax=Candidatus Syntropharchaeum butanivorans TaxID=1839936 RepID=A0A1F2P5I5_9EURY|nr:MAG: archaeosortase C, PEF-CTERM variant [Candidatus Syntrophoarchaeum butanivorans]HEC57320.1 archaeosortase C [Candidatus Syntrophoarchaeum butanivorans]